MAGESPAVLTISLAQLDGWVRPSSLKLVMGMQTLLHVRISLSLHAIPSCRRLMSSEYGFYIYQHRRYKLIGVSL